MGSPAGLRTQTLDRVETPPGIVRRRRVDRRRVVDVRSRFKKNMDADSLCGPSPAEAVDEGRRESLERTARDDEAQNVEMRESGECLPSIDEAFPARPPKPPAGKE